MQLHVLPAGRKRIFHEHAQDRRVDRVGANRKGVREAIADELRVVRSVAVPPGRPFGEQLHLIRLHAVRGDAVAGCDGSKHLEAGSSFEPSCTG